MIASNMAIEAGGKKWHHVDETTHLSMSAPFVPINRFTPMLMPSFYSDRHYDVSTIRSLLLLLHSLIGSLRPMNAATN